MAEGGYRTRQKAEILDLIGEKGDYHFTAADIAEMLRKKGSGTGMSTVYRMLDKLTEEGTLRRYVIDGSSAACYQIAKADQNACRHHFHLKCLNCGSLFHVDCELIDKLTKHIATDHGFTVDHSKTVLYGYCEKCRSAENTEKGDLQ